VGNATGRRCFGRRRYCQSRSLAGAAAESIATAAARASLMAISLRTQARPASTAFRGRLSFGASPRSTGVRARRSQCDLISLRVIIQALQGFARACESPYPWSFSKGFPLPWLLCVAGLCARGGVRVVSGAGPGAWCSLRGCCSLSVRFCSCTRRHHLPFAGIGASGNAENIETTQSGCCRSLPWSVRHGMPQSPIAW
jgi:hypothetical protein